MVAPPQPSQNGYEPLGKTMTTASDVAYWMLSELERQGGYLDEAKAAAAIEERFGREFVSRNARGELLINRVVIDAFTQLSWGAVRWDQTERAWCAEDNGRLA